jgi:hypothetical protein
MQRLRPALLHLALLALILRGFLPTGWMPNPQGPSKSPFVICTMAGPVLGVDGKALPDKDDPRAHETCPFAAAAALATPPNAISLAARESFQYQQPHYQASAVVLPAAFSKPSSRAPPSLT